MRSATITKTLGGGVYWVDFREDGRPVGLASYIFRRTAVRAAERFVAGKSNPYLEEVK